ncbi:MAG TPA: ROK family protein [Solirubrobacterales bacterium]|nr:ROK family protein [Solirubrobacterales bacterium]
MGPAPSPATSRPLAAIGADLGGTKMLVGVVEDGPRVLYEATEASMGRSQEDILEGMESALRKALEAHPEARAAGLGIPCTIDQERGLAIAAVNLDIVDVPVRDIMAERLGIPVVLDNDANAAALAEHRWGAARGTRNAVILTIGTGIGGGLIIDGGVYRGSTGAGAELGHMVIDHDGPPCQGNCPNHGCAEAVASGTALGREALQAAESHPDSALGQLLEAGQQVDGRAATVAALAGDEVAIGVIETIGRRLGAYASGLVNVFEPEVIVFGGGVLAAGDLLLDPVRDEVERRALKPMNRTRIAHAELGPEAGMIGAATMAMDTDEHL